ncbi:glycoside hydrolase family 31 protein [Paenibacillus sp. J5C_2022]|uniref:glycoside hydrolase family 31 protein n=1 Tax=Paenibacillus sp. J5C2022 TaxID=2977129 RepID=UPI0021CE7DC5|nr:glycoside hydrolase family 31 protein [Paenibacillus sp. J5C2022]MCU6709285.1 glycoside hydrolase family 31 protein [Paenibacillus sp. J5C2022]
MEGSAAIHPEKMGMREEGKARQQLGAVRSVERVGNAYVIRGEKGGMALVFLSDEIVRMKVLHGKEALAAVVAGGLDLSTTPGVVPQDRTGEAVVEETDAAIAFATDAIKLVLDKRDFSFRIEDKSGKQVVEQKTVSWNARGELTAMYGMPSDSHFYGLGEKTGFLDKRGERYTNWNTDVFAPHVPEIEALYESIPLVIHMHSGLSCGLFLDNPGRTDVDMRSHSTEAAFSMGCSTGSYDLYYIHGPSLKEVVSRYTSLTGRMELPPKWALGYHQSRYSYMNQQEVLELARMFREKAIPCDVIYLDIHYMDEYRVFTFDPVRFPDPEGMMAELKAMGIRIVPIVDPGVKKDPKYRIYREGVQDNHFVRRLEGDIALGEVWPGISAFPDFTEDRTAEWWGEQHRYYTDLGIAGIWNDMNEPALFNESKTMDLDAMHGNNGDPKTHEELHNLYGMLMSKATYEGLGKLLDGERPFVLTRAGYAGIQRYAAVWTGDNRSFWEHMAMAMPMVLNMGLSGIPFAGPDIGGFAHDTSGELLVRWTQMGAFFPYCRNHSNLGTVRQEPWSFGGEIEEIVRQYIGLRYRFMPHLYNLFHEAAATGLPVMRPLLLEYPNDPEVTNLCDQFLVGEHLLIAPVYRPGTSHRAVYLPEGTWIDFWTGESHMGGRHILAHAPLETMPIYVKAGAIVPEGPLEQYAGEAAGQSAGMPITFHAYGASVDAGFGAAYSLYEDDGSTYAYREGAYSRLDVSAAGDGNGVEVSWTYGEKGCAYASGREQLRFSFRQSAFEAAGVEGMEKISPEQMASGAEGWLVSEAAGELIVQVADRKSGGNIRITAR